MYIKRLILYVRIVFKPSRHSSGKASVKAKSLKASSGEMFNSLSLRLFLD